MKQQPSGKKNVRTTPGGVVLEIEGLQDLVLHLARRESHPLDRWARAASSRSKPDEPVLRPGPGHGLFESPWLF